MTLLEFASSIKMDWKAIFDYLADVGAELEENPNWVIERDWLLELRKTFPIQEDNSEVEKQLVAEDIKYLDADTQKKLEEEKTNLILKNESFDTAKIDIDPKQLTLDIVIRRLENNEIQLDPEFQRGENLWDTKRQSKLIESILIKLPLPAFYFDAISDGRWAVIDGLQRLSTINNFVVKKTLKLDGLDFLKGLETKGYEDLPRPLHRRIQETVIFAFLIKPGTPNDLKYNIFKRINTGGLILTPQEIRHALNQGIPANLLKKLSELEVFKQATGYSLVNNNRMVDRDYINRFVAFYLQGYAQYERGDDGLDGFLNKGMAMIDEYNQSQIEQKFMQAMQAAFEIFGSDAFRKRYEYPWIKRRKPLNKALFEVWAVNLANISEEECHRLIQKKDWVLEQSARLLEQDGYFDVSITYATGDANRVRYRFEKIRKLVELALF